MKQSNKFRYVVTIPSPINFDTVDYKFFYLTLEDFERNSEAVKEWREYLFDDSSRKIVARNRFTGLADKTENEIFEGDIVKYYNNIGYVAWIEKDACFAFQEFAENGHIFGLYGLAADDLEVVGNIFKNREFLTVSD